MPKIDLSSAFAAEAARLRGLGRNANRTLQRAVGTLARRLPVEARRDIQSEVALKASRIAQGLSTRQEEGAVVLIGSRRGIGLIEFGGRWGGRSSAGATAGVRLGGGSRVYVGAFIARGRSGNRQIFARQRIGGRRAGRLPLKTLYGPSIAVLLRHSARRARLADVAQSVLAAEIDRLLGR